MADLPEIGTAAVDRKEYFFSSWFEYVKQHTMDTQSFPLEMKEAQVLLKKREKARTKHYVVQHQKERGTKDEDIEREMEKQENFEWAKKAEDMRLSFSTFSLEKYPSVTLSDNDEEVLRGLEEKIQRAITELSPEGAFLKLSCRSPKDAAMTTDDYPSILREEIDEIQKEFANEIGSNEGVNLMDVLPVAFCRSSLRSLMVKSGKEAVSLLLSSQRVYDDLLLALHRVREKGVEWEMEVIIREWSDIDPATEVRVFVVDRKIVALSQYQEMYFIPQFNDPNFRKEYESNIFSLFSSLSASLPFDDCTLDFAVDRRTKNLSIIEINPPPPLAGTPFFSWNSPEDRQILREGPYQFRYLKNNPRTLQSVPPKCREIMRKHLGLESLNNLSSSSSSSPPSSSSCVLI